MAAIDLKLELTLPPFNNSITFDVPLLLITEFVVVATLDCDVGAFIQKLNAKLSSLAYKNCVELNGVLIILSTPLNVAPIPEAV